MHRHAPAILAVFILVLFPVLVSFAQDPKPVKPKQPRPRLEDAIRRAALKAASIDTLKIMRLTVVPGETEDEENYVVLVEFGTGDFAFFQGGMDAESDQWVLIAKRQADVVEETVFRSKKR